MTRNISALIAAMAMASLTHTPLMAQTNYPVNFDETTAPTPDADKASRTTNAINLNGTDGSQAVQVNQKAANLVYIKRLSDSFTAKAGETVTPSFSAVMDWMHGYVYVDWGRDGQFDVDFNDAGVTAAKDLVAYTYYKSRNSNGANVTNQNPGYNPPAFVVPAGTANGFYRVRYKIDWDNVDPGGASNMPNFGGVIVDTRLNVHGDNANLVVNTMEHGTLTLEDGTPLASGEVPFGEAITVKVAPEEGYSISSIRIKHGYNLDGEQTVNDVPQWQENTVRSFLIKDGICTIPAKYIDGDVQITATFAKGGTSVDGEYKLGFDEKAEQTEPTNALTGITLTNAAGTVATVNVGEGSNVYRNLLDTEVGVKPGDVLTPAVTLNGESNLKAYLYIDYDQNGGFSTELTEDGAATDNSELVSFSSYNGKNSLGEEATEGVAMPAFTLPEELPTGMYRARLKLDTDNIDAAGSEGISAANGYVVDFLLNVHNDAGKLAVDTWDGHIIGVNNGTVGESVNYGNALSLHTMAPADGHVLESLEVYHGHNLKGAQYVHGNRQWDKYVVEGAEANADFTIPAEVINGDVLVKAKFATDGTEEYKLVFCDEFNQEDGSDIDPDKWNISQRNSSTWSRLLAKSSKGRKLVSYIEDGKYVSRAIPTPEDLIAIEASKDEATQMITGGIDGKDLNNFTYGRFEARIKTTPHKGNFPAFWLMPQDMGAGWPKTGEIDIWEQIDTENRAYGTIHTHCTAELNKCKPNSGNVQYNPAEYTVFQLDWTPTRLTWYVNGKQSFTYTKTDNAQDLADGQWPFTKGFYLILNQSVGNGSWAKKPDQDFTYVTYFDYVRVYQTEDMENELNVEEDWTGVKSIDKSETAGVYALDGGLVVNTAAEELVNIYDLQGRRVFAQKVNGTKFVSLAKGMYIVGGKKYLVK